MSHAPDRQHLSQRVICTAMCALIGMPVLPMVPAMAVEKSDAKKAETTGVKPSESNKKPQATTTKPEVTTTKPEATTTKPAEGAKKTDSKSSATETGGSKAAAIVKEAISKSNDGAQKADSAKKAETAKPADTKKPVESARKTDIKLVKPEVTGSKAAAVVKEAVSNSQKAESAQVKEPASKAAEPAKAKEPATKETAKTTKVKGPALTTKEPIAKAKETTAKAKETTAKVPKSSATKAPKPSDTKAPKSSKKGTGPTAKVTDMVPPVAPAIRPGSSAGGPSMKAADDAAFARQFVQSNSNPTAKGAHPGATPGAQQNADNQASRIARPGMPAPGGTSNASLDNQSPRIARPGMPVGGSGAAGQGAGNGSANGAPSTASGSPGTATGAPGTAHGAPGTASGAPKASTRAAGGAPPAKASDVPPPLAPPVTTGGTASQVPKAPNVNVQDDYPAVGSLEQVTFGTTNPGTPIEQRITTLESAIFAKTYETESLFDRTERLKRTLMGQSETDGGGAAPGAPYGGTAGQPPTIPGAPGTGFGTDPNQALTPDAVANMQALADLAYLEEFADKPENRKQEPPNVIEGFAAEVVNFERRKRGLPPLENDVMLSKMAKGHVADLHKTSALSHTDSRGNNPDRRFTVLGGVDAVNESLAAIDSADLGTSRPTKAAVAKSFKRMMMRTDDRDILMSPDASHMGFAMGANSDGTRVLSCTEVLTKRAVIQPLPHTVRLGEKVEVQGILMNPYKFDKVTIAWEGKSEDGAVQSYEQVDDALPYFPPLDYIAYKDHSEKDYTKTINTLKTLGMIAAIAGGMFMPPVALAAPLIVMAGPNPEPKPQSDIPVKGSVHVDGQSFDVKIPLSNDSKEGLYYITVWANQGEGTRPVPVSRRTIHVTADEARLAKANTKDVIEEDATGEVEPASNSASNNPNPFLDTPLSQLKAEPKSLSDLPPAQDASNAPKPTDALLPALAAPAAAKLTDAPPLPPSPTATSAPQAGEPKPSVGSGVPNSPAQPANVNQPVISAAPPAAAQVPAQAAPPAAAQVPAQAAPPAAAPQAPAQAAPPAAAQGPPATQNAATSSRPGNADPSLGGLRPAIAQPKPAGGPSGGSPNNAPNNPPNNSNKSELKSDVPEQPTIQ